MVVCPEDKTLLDWQANAQHDQFVTFTQGLGLRIDQTWRMPYMSTYQQAPASWSIDQGNDRILPQNNHRFILLLILLILERRWEAGRSAM